MPYGPYEKMPGTPWFSGPSLSDRSRGGGSLQAAPTFQVSQTLTFKQKISANPGVLATGRRPDRPGHRG